MSNVCDHCQETFYSDSSYHEHQMLVLLEQTVKSNEQAGRALGATFGELRVMNIIKLRDHHGCSMEEAVEHEWRLHRTINQVYDRLNKELEHGAGS